MFSVSRSRAGLFGLLAVLIAVVSVGGASPAQATTYAPLIADGSSWAGPAIDQWSSDVSNRGISINFSGDGSARGRQNYATKQADFAASDIAYLTQGDPFGGGIESVNVAYSYVPIVAGGTAFMYNLHVGGRKIDNMRLSGATIAKIFTGAITNWDDKAITHDYGAQLPSEKITPVTRTDGSGASYMFSQWMANQYPTIWYPFCHAKGGAGSCGPTEFYPGFDGSVQRNGSDQVANFVGSDGTGEGSIGYDEYSYAKLNNITTVNVLNKAGYYVDPSASNVAIALQAAEIDENPASLTFLMQKLDKVYINPDPRAYPVSSYSYLIVPRTSRVINGNQTGPPSTFNTTKGATLSTWMNYVLCGAQQSAEQLGYSPLPHNLVVGGFTQVDNIPGHVPTPNVNTLSNCNNPTYHDGVNYLIKNAPYPTKCQKLGSPLDCAGGITLGAGSPNGGGKSNTGGGSKTGNSTTGNQNNNTGNTSNTGTGTTKNNTATGPLTNNTSSSSNNSNPLADPLGGGGSGGGDGSGNSSIYANPVALQKSSSGSGLMTTLTAIDILAALAVPAVLGAWLRRRKRSAG